MRKSVVFPLSLSCELSAIAACSCLVVDCGRNHGFVSMYVWMLRGSLEVAVDSGVDASTWRQRMALVFGRQCEIVSTGAERIPCSLQRETHSPHIVVGLSFP